MPTFIDEELEDYAVLHKDPHPNISSIVHESGESLSCFSAPVSTVKSETILQSLEENLYRVLCFAPDKTRWGPVVGGHNRLRYGFVGHYPPGEDAAAYPDPYGCHDYLLWTSMTSFKTPDTAESGGITNLQPVVVTFEGQEEEPTPLLATYLEGVISSHLDYDEANQTYHLWYWAYGWTSATVTNNVGPGNTLCPVSTLHYDSNDNATFDAENFFIIPDVNLKLIEMPEAVLMLFYTSGKREVLRDLNSTTPSTPPTEGTAGVMKPYLVVKQPKILTYWSLECLGPLPFNPDLPVPERETSSSSSSSSSSQSSGSSASSPSSASSTGSLSGSFSGTATSSGPAEVYIPLATRVDDYIRLPVGELSFNAELMKVEVTEIGFDEVYLCCDFL